MQSLFEVKAYLAVPDYEVSVLPDLIVKLTVFLENKHL